MANYLVSNVIDDFQRAYPKVTDADALALFKHVYIEVLARAEVEGGTESKNLTSGTREYELTYDPQILRTTVVYYTTAANTSTRLEAVTVAWMDENMSNWRDTDDTGTPTRYYIDYPTSAALTTQGKVVIGLDPIPDTTTSGGYPVVTIYGTEYEEPAATSDIPMAFPSIRVFVEGMKKIYASDRDPEKYRLYRDAYEDELANALHIIHNRSAEIDAPIIRAKWMNTRRVV